MKVSMMSSSCIWVVFVVLSVSGHVVEMKAVAYVWCSNNGTRWYGRSLACPSERPYTSSQDPKAKVCHVNCNSPYCKSECKRTYTHTYILPTLIYSFYLLYTYIYITYLNLLVLLTMYIHIYYPLNLLVLTN